MQKIQKLTAVMLSVVLLFALPVCVTAQSISNVSADVSHTTGYTNTNQDIFFSGADGLALSAVVLNGKTLDSDYRYYQSAGRLILDSSLFKDEGNYELKAEFSDKEGNNTTAEAVIPVTGSYIYYNNFDEYNEEALSKDPLGAEIGSGVTGSSSVAPELSYIPQTLRYADETTYRHDVFNSHGDAGKVQNRIVDYTAGGKTSKGITLEAIDSSYHWGGYRPSITLDLDRVFKNPLNKQTLGSEKLNFSYRVTLNYDNPQYLQTFRFSFDNSTHTDNWRDDIFYVDPVWGMVVRSGDIQFNPYFRENNQNYGELFGDSGGRTPWYKYYDSTALFEFTLDMADADVYKLYMKINGKEFYYKYTVDGVEHTADYITLADRQTANGSTVNDYFGLANSWSTGLFPHGNDGITMLKFSQNSGDNPIVIDDISVQSEVARIKTEISAISDAETYEDAKNAADKINEDIQKLSESDRAAINNIKLMDYEYMFGKADVSYTSGLTNTNQDIFYEKVEGMNVKSVLINGSLLSDDLYKYDSTAMRLTIDDSVFNAAGSYVVETTFTDAAKNTSSIKSTLSIANRYIYINDFDGYSEEELAADPFGQNIGSSVTGVSKLVPEWSVMPYTARFSDDTYRKDPYNGRPAEGTLQNRIVEYEVNGKTTRGITLDTPDPSRINYATDNPSVTLDLDRVYGKVINADTMGSDKVKFAYRVTLNFDAAPDRIVNNFEFTFDNCLIYGPWRTSLFKIDTNWGITMDYTGENGENISYNGYEKITGNFIRDGVGTQNDLVAWNVLNNSTAYIEMMLDMADIENLKLYMSVSGKEYEFEYTDENGVTHKTDYIPLPNKPMFWNGTQGEVENFFGVLGSMTGWLGSSSFFPHGYNGITMLKFKQPTAGEYIVIDDVCVQREVDEIISGIASLSDIEDYNKRAEKADMIWTDYLTLSDRDRAVINNIGLLKEYGLYHIDDAYIEGNTVKAEIEVQTEKAFKVVVGIYEDNGRYLKQSGRMVLDSSDIKDGIAEFSFEEISDNATVKVMIWNEDLSRPLCSTVSIK